MGFGNSLTQAYLQTQQQRFNEALQLAQYILQQQQLGEQSRQFESAAQRDLAQQAAVQKRFEDEFGLRKAAAARDERLFPIQEEQAKLQLQNLQRGQELAPVRDFYSALSSAAKDFSTWGEAFNAAARQSGLPPEEIAGIRQEWFRQALPNIPAAAKVMPSMAYGFATGGVPGLGAAAVKALSSRELDPFAAQTPHNVATQARIDATLARARVNAAKAANLETVDRELGQAKLESTRLNNLLRKVELSYSDPMYKARLAEAQSRIQLNQASSGLATARAANVRAQTAGATGAPGGASPMDQRYAMRLYGDLQRDVRALSGNKAAAEALVIKLEGSLQRAKAELEAWRKQDAESDGLTGSDVGRYIAAEGRVAEAEAALAHARQRLATLRDEVAARRETAEALLRQYKLPAPPAGGSASGAARQPTYSSKAIVDAILKGLKP